MRGSWDKILISATSGQSTTTILPKDASQKPIWVSCKQDAAVLVRTCYSIAPSHLFCSYRCFTFIVSSVGIDELYRIPITNWMNLLLRLIQPQLLFRFRACPWHSPIVTLQKPHSIPKPSQLEILFILFIIAERCLHTQKTWRTMQTSFDSGLKLLQARNLPTPVSVKNEIEDHCSF